MRSCDARVCGVTGLMMPESRRASTLGMLESGGVQRVILASSRKEPGAGAFCFPVLTQQLEQTGRKHDVPVLVTLGLADTNHHSL